MLVWVLLGWLAMVALIALCLCGAAGSESRREEHRTAGELGRKAKDTWWWED